MNNHLVARLTKLLNEDSELQEVVNFVHKTGIRAALFAGAHVSLLTKNRPPTDYDFLSFQNDLSILEKEFPNSTTSGGKSGYIVSKLVYPFGDKHIEFVGDIKITIKSHVYRFSMTELAWNNVERHTIGDSVFCSVNPADTIILKAILQRGKDVGKSDTDDIRSLVKYGLVNKTYLHQRLKEVNADQRVVSYLKDLKVLS